MIWIQIRDEAICFTFGEGTVRGRRKKLNQNECGYQLHYSEILLATEAAASSQARMSYWCKCIDKGVDYAKKYSLYEVNVFAQLLSIGYGYLLFGAGTKSIFILAIYLSSLKISKYEEDMRDTAREARMNSLMTFSYGTLHLDVHVLVNQ